MAFSTWRPMTQAEVERVPACPGVFELATLVRTVVFIGAAPESLASALEQHLALPAGASGPRIASGRLYFRYRATEEVEQLQSDLLEEYRRHHGGALPPGQSIAPALVRPRRHLKAV